MIIVFLVLFGIILAIIGFAIVSLVAFSFILEMNVNGFLKIIMLAVLFSFSASFGTVATVSVLEYVLN